MVHPNHSDITIITVKGADCHCIIYEVNKSDAIRLLKHSVPNDCGID